MQEEHTLSGSAPAPRDVPAVVDHDPLAKAASARVSTVKLLVFHFHVLVSHSESLNLADAQVERNLVLPLEGDYLIILSHLFCCLTCSSFGHEELF